jgi:hypothetical protein
MPDDGRPRKRSLTSRSDPTSPRGLHVVESLVRLGMSKDYGCEV